MSVIENGLRADIMRKRMEDKNTLQHKGSLYVGTGNNETMELTWSNGVLAVQDYNKDIPLTSVDLKPRYTSADTISGIIWNNVQETLRASKLTSFQNAFVQCKGTVTDIDEGREELIDYSFECSNFGAIQFFISWEGGQGDGITNEFFLINNTFDMELNTTYKFYGMHNNQWGTDPLHNIPIQITKIEDDKYQCSWTITITVNDDINNIQFKYRILK